MNKIDADLQRLDGGKPGTYKYLYKDNIFYKLADNNSTKETYECSYKKSKLYHCEVRITRNINGKLILNPGKKGHEHDPRPNVIEIDAMKKKLRDAAKHPGKPQVIYDQVIKSYPNAALAVPLRVAAGIINRVRKNNWITKAESFEELAEKLSKHHEYKKYYQALLYPSNGDEGTILFFADNDVLKRLNKAKNLYFDGNFKITSNHPESMQVWNILMDEHGSDKTETLFVGFAWCTNANQGTYRAVIDYLKTRAPQLHNSIETIYTDFEQAAILAYYYELPNAKIHGCYFHYTQCITKHFDDVKLSQPTSTNPDSNEKSKRKKPPKEILFVARVLPLLPPDDLEKGIQVLANLIDKHIGKWPDLQTFKDYIYKQWAGKAKLLSCFREPIRTNNKSEAFNRTLLTRFGGKHPTLGTFLYNMCGIIFAEKSNAYRQIQSHRETKIQQNYNKNMKIKNLEDALEKKLIKVEDFLYEVMSDENREIISREKSYRAEELYDDKNKIKEQKKGQDDLQTFKNKGKPITVPEQYEPDYGTKKKSKRKLSKSPIQSNTYRYAEEIIDENMNHDTLIESSKLNAKSKPTKKKTPSLKRTSKSTIKNDNGQPDNKKPCHEQKQEIFVDDEDVKSYLIEKYPSLAQKFQQRSHII